MTIMFNTLDREYLKRVVTSVLSFVLSVAILTYIGYHIWRKATSEVTVETVYPQSSSDVLSFESLIIRDETLLKGSGTPSAIVREGEKVSKNELVVKTYGSVSADARTRLAEIDTLLGILDSIGSKENLTMTNASATDKKTYASLDSIRESFSNGNFGDAHSLRSSFIADCDRSGVITGKIADLGALRQSLEGEKTSVQAQFGTAGASICTPVSGYYYSSVDGYETLFSSSSVNTLTYEEFSEKMRSEPVSASGTVGKIVTSPVWYAYCPVSAADAKLYSVGDWCDVHFTASGTASIEMQVVRTLESGNDGAIIFKTDLIPEGFTFDRTQPAEVTVREYDGLGVPKSAVRISDGVTGVYTLDGTKVVFKRVEILAEYESQYIVTETDPLKVKADAETGDGADAETDTAPNSPYSYIARSDSVIIEGKGLYNGKIIAR